MFVVSVIFDIEPISRDRFRRAILANARTSLAEESGCLRFDVAEDEATGRFILWEVYTDKAAFDAHVATQHFEAFDRIVASWVRAKAVETFHLVSDL